MLPSYNLCKRDELSEGSSSIQRHTGQDFQAADRLSGVQDKRMHQRREDRHLPVKSKEKFLLRDLSLTGICLKSPAARTKTSLELFNITDDKLPNSERIVQLKGVLC